MARANFVKRARKARPDHDIKKGDSYFWWSFRFGGKHYSKTQPKRSQLTQSAFLSTIWGIEDDQLGVIELSSNFEEEIESIVSDLESLRDETQDSLDNIPEQLQSGSAGTLLEERVDALDEMISELEGVETDVDVETEEGESVADYNGRVEDRQQEILDEIQGIAYQGE